MEMIEKAAVVKEESDLETDKAARREIFCVVR